MTFLRGGMQRAHGADVVSDDSQCAAAASLSTRKVCWLGRPTLSKRRQQVRAGSSSKRSQERPGSTFPQTTMSRWSAKSLFLPASFQVPSGSPAPSLCQPLPRRNPGGVEHRCPRMEVDRARPPPRRPPTGWRARRSSSDRAPTRPAEARGAVLASRRSAAAIRRTLRPLPQPRAGIESPTSISRARSADRPEADCDRRTSATPAARGRSHRRPRGPGWSPSCPRSPGRSSARSGRPAQRPSATG